MHSCKIAGAAPRPERRWRRAICALALSLALAACATQPRHPPPPAAPPSAAPTVAAPAPQAEAPKKPKPKTKPSTPAPAPAPKPSEGLVLADVGYYMDVMQGRLQQLGASGVSVVRQDTRIVVTASAVFDAAAGRLELDPAHGRAFAAIAKVLGEYRQTRVTIRARAPTDGALAAACESALQRYLVAAGVALQQLVPAAAAAGGSVPDTATATLELDIAPLVRDG